MDRLFDWIDTNPRRFLIALTGHTLVVTSFVLLTALAAP